MLLLILQIYYTLINPYLSFPRLTSQYLIVCYQSIPNRHFPNIAFRNLPLSPLRSSYDQLTIATNFMRIFLQNLTHSSRTGVATQTRSTTKVMLLGIILQPPAFTSIWPRYIILLPL